MASMTTIRYSRPGVSVTLTSEHPDVLGMLECARRHLFERDEAAEKASEVRFLAIMRARKEREKGVKK